MRQWRFWKKPMTNLPHWPPAYPKTEATGNLKQHNADFKVTEIPLVQPSGAAEDEHIWLYIEKNGANTAWIAKRIAEVANVKEMDVGYAGMKDRHSISRQWFSIYLPRVAEPDFSQLNDDEVTLLEQTRHSKKLRRGDLVGNHFEIRLRDIQGDQAAIERSLEQVKALGVPNYFGEQRFGRDGNNIEAGRAMLAGETRVKQRNKKSIYLSAIRSLLFNEVLAARIQQGFWGQTLEGDVLNNEQQPTGPMWGRGRSSTSAQALDIEQLIIDKYATLADGLEHAGLKQERRDLVSKPKELSWKWLHNGEQTDLVLSFSLAAGHYATSVLKELLDVFEVQK